MRLCRKLRKGFSQALPETWWLVTSGSKHNARRSWWNTIITVNDVEQTWLPYGAGADVTRLFAMF